MCLQWSSRNILYSMCVLHVPRPKCPTPIVYSRSLCQLKNLYNFFDFKDRQARDACALLVLFLECYDVLVRIQLLPISKVYTYYQYVHQRPHATSGGKMNANRLQHVLYILPLYTGFASFLHVYLQVGNDLQAHADRSPGLLVNIVEARRRLVGMETSDLLRLVRSLYS